jgi:hypothetical protein
MLIFVMVDRQIEAIRSEIDFIALLNTSMMSDQNDRHNLW